MQRLLLAVGLLMALTLTACARPAPTLDLKTEQVGSDLKIEVVTTNFSVGKSGHVHLRLNDGPETMLINPTYTLRNLQPGTYKVWVELSDPNHKPLNVSRTVEVVMK